MLAAPCPPPPAGSQEHPARLHPGDWAPCVGMLLLGLSLVTIKAPVNERGLQKRQESLYGGGRCFGPAAQERSCGTEARWRTRTHTRWAGVSTEERGHGNGINIALHWGDVNLLEKRLANACLEWYPALGQGSHLDLLKSHLSYLFLTIQ